MIYFYRCENPLCSFLLEAEHPVNGFKEFQPRCTKCGEVCTYEFNPTVVQFAIKDGPSGTSPSKAMRIQKQMREKHERVGRKQQDRYGHLRRDVVPNFQGKMTENWREAQSLAMADKDFHEANRTDSLAVASTFNDKINKEKQGDSKIAK